MLPASATASAIWRSRNFTRRPIRSVHFIRYLSEWLGICSRKELISFTEMWQVTDREVHFTPFRKQDTNRRKPCPDFKLQRQPSFSCTAALSTVPDGRACTA